MAPTAPGVVAIIALGPGAVLEPPAFTEELEASEGRWDTITLVISV
jgi:hypothetical protein